MHVVLQGSGAGDVPGGYGLALLQSLLALGAVCLLAWALLRWLGRRGFGRPPRGSRLRVIERTPLDGQRALYLVQVGDRVWLVGAGEGASPSLVAELDSADLPPEPEVARGGSGAVLGKLGRREAP
ncbi:MAG: flagellar biosynthetic protein FliO [Myxococcota bacterium]